jgi:SpoVK/Ycf46/Vps4 family AAA+-type ATPase
MSEDANEDFAELDDFNDRAGSAVASSNRRSAYPGAPTAEAEDGEEEPKSKDASMWAKQGTSFFPCDEAVKQLLPAQYEICSSQSAGIYFKQANSKFDELIKLPDSASESIVEAVATFWKKEEHFRKFGFLWKRGILLWGPPGSGKTCTLQQVSQHIIDEGGIAVYATHPGTTAAGLGIMRRIEPVRPIVVMMEDLDAMIQQFGEADVLALLDGELQIDNVVFIATTNYPERLDKRIVNRPSRFDIVKLIDMPNEEARRVYLTAKNDRLTEEGNADELDKWVRGTNRYSIAHLKELIVSVEVFEVDLDKALKRLGKMIDQPPKSSDATAPSTGQFL